jgi:formylglycine-generating enzyme required for sulfatase activity/tRNA A-37 threonylcarbamoyl transferase component Bud32
MMQIPGYTIIRELGSGGMATVYLARQDRLGRQVALKVMKPQAVRGDDFASRFTKEGRIVARLQHPQIVTIYDFDIADGLHYFSMEYLPNGTLSEKIAYSLSTEQAIDIARGIAQALWVAHNHGVIHRDIKPQNILFRTDGTPVLTDFGIARAVGAGPEATQLTTVGMVIGSPRYMSPEQSMSRPIDARSDLYSLGVVLYEMLTKELPYQADDVISLAMKHCSAPIPVLPSPLQIYQPIIEKLLAKDPEDRFGSAQELIWALDVLQTGQRTIPAYDEEETRIVRPNRPAPKPEPDKPPRPKKTKRILIVVTILALLAAIGLYFLIRVTETDPRDRFAADIGLPVRAADRPEITERYERLALEHLRNNQLPRGLGLVKLALESSPGDVRLKKLEGWIADRLEADKLLREAEGRLEKQDFDASLALVERGLELVGEHQGLKALREKVLQERAKHNAAQAQELLEQAQAAYDRGNFAASMEITIDGLVLAPEDTRLKALEARLKDRLEQQRALRETIDRASALLDKGRLAEGLKEVQRGLASALGDPELLDLKTRILEGIERETAQKAEQLLRDAEQRLGKRAFDESLALIEQGLDISPQHPGLTALRERVLEERAKHQAARAAELRKQAQAAFDADDLAKSLRLCKEGISLAPADAQLNALKTKVEKQIAQEELTAVVAQASNLLGQGQLAEARTIVEEALKFAPDNAELLDLDKMVKEQIAREAAEEATKLGNEAQALAQQGNFDEAWKRLGSALQLQPDDSALADLKKKITAAQSKHRANALFERARNALAEVRLAEALDLTRKGLGEQPGHAGLQELQAKIQSRIEEETTVAEATEKVQSLLREGRFDDCLKALDIALERYPANTRLLSTRGEVENAQKQERGKKARESLQQASRLVGMGDLDAAMEWVSKGLESSPQNPDLLSMRSRIEEGRRKREEVAQLLPEMVAIKKGCFQMGSPAGEPDREADEQSHRVCVEGFELAKYETRFADFKRFADAEGYKTDAQRGVDGVIGCWTLDLEAKSDAWGYYAWANWRKPTKYQDPAPDEPVTCVSKSDAQAYIRWLNKVSGQSYRLPSEAEWEYAARAATTTTRYWGNATDQTVCRNANVADKGHKWDDGFPCDDGYEWVAPTGRFAPNPWGLYDMLGNVSEWTCSRYVANYGGAEAQCMPNDSLDPAVLRGGGWNSGPAATRAAYRDRNYRESRYSFVGFRLARDAGAKK